jgi:hypothetical protein
VVIGEGCVATFPYDHGKAQRPFLPFLNKFTKNGKILRKADRKELCDELYYRHVR